MKTVTPVDYCAIGQWSGFEGHVAIQGAPCVTVTFDVALVSVEILNKKQKHARC